MACEHHVIMYHMLLFRARLKKKPVTISEHVATNRGGIHCETDYRWPGFSDRTTESHIGPVWKFQKMYKISIRKNIVVL